MKKLKKQTGLVQKADTAKTKKRKDSSAKSKKKAGATAKKRSLPKGFKEKQYKPKSFGELTGGKVRATDFSTEELIAVNKRLASVANKRLKRLEKAGFTKGAYKAAKTQLATQGREKFTGAAKGKTREQLTAEFIRMRSFLSAKTSTAEGISDWKNNVYKALQKAGFTGTADELTDLFNKYFTKELEEALGSDVAYEMIRSEDGRTKMQDLQNAIRESMKRGQSPKEALASYFGVPIDKVAGAALIASLGV